MFLARRFENLGLTLHTPDFNQPDFSTLTISRMLQQLEKRITASPPGDVVLIGSSLGGFLAVEAAARHVSKARHPIARVVLLAPAVELEWDRWTELDAGGGVEQWRKDGDIEIFHYADGTFRRLKFGFYEDALRYRAADKRLQQPMVIFQGLHDESVDPARVEAFARAQPSATLHLLEDGHQLKNSLDFIWQETARFLGLAPRP
jgi:pimeloyl-ACP methyl ester carboxylesterase